MENNSNKNISKKPMVISLIIVVVIIMGIVAMSTLIKPKSTKPTFENTIYMPKNL